MARVSRLRFWPKNIPFQMEYHTEIASEDQFSRLKKDYRGTPSYYDLLLAAERDNLRHDEGVVA